MTGVMVSITPKIKPVRKASLSRGLCRLAPLPMAAANASVDIANASKAVETRFMRGGNSGRAPKTVRRARPATWSVYGLARPRGLRAPRQSNAENVDAGASGVGSRLLPKKEIAV